MGQGGREIANFVVHPAKNL